MTTRIVLLLVLLLGACGYKADLVLPTDSHDGTATEAGKKKPDEPDR